LPINLTVCAIWAVIFLKRKLLKSNFAICAQYAQTPSFGWWCYTWLFPKDGCAEEFRWYPIVGPHPNLWTRSYKWRK